ncbi:hypothetical protein CsatB_013878 [Cannabis sativa]
MEDDDEFGDLYTDVLQPFASSSSSSVQQPHHPSVEPPQPFRPPIDLNLNLKSDVEDTMLRAPSINSVLPVNETDETLVPGPPPAVSVDSVTNNSIIPGEVVVVDDAVARTRVSLSGDLKLRDGVVEDSNSNLNLNYGVGESGNDVVMKQSCGEVENLMEKDVTFDIEEGNMGMEDVGSEPMIPGLESSVPIGGTMGDVDNVDASMGVRSLGGDGVDEDDAAGGDGDDWDSDSEDDLQIVLNDNNHGPLAMERGGMGGGDDDEDEDGLVIVTNDDPNQVMEEQEWGEDSAQVADGERKEVGEAGKVGAGIVAPQKIGYNTHGYHPFHSQFKYVRPGAAPIPGATTSGPGGVPGQVRPPISMGPMPGRGRGDWRPMGLKTGTPMQKNFHSGFGGPNWGGNTAGRGFSGGGGLEFTLPSHKTIFEVDIDSFEEKPWKYPNVDISDFFNFGLNEDTWKDYCKQLEQLRLESTMQSKIRVYESGRAEQEYDPDLPPELAAAAGIHEVPSSDNASSGKLGQGDLPKGSARVRPPLPTGRAIQVENGYGERLPSIDTRPARNRDSDAIIEIVLQGSLDDDVSAGNDIPNRSDNDTSKEDFGGVADTAPVNPECSDNFPQTYNDRKREPVEPRMPQLGSVSDDIPDRNGVLPFPPGPPVRNVASSANIREYPDDDPSAGYEERRIHGRTHDRSPRKTLGGSGRDKKYLNNDPEESVESMDSKNSLPLSSPAAVRDAQESSFEQRDVDDQDELVLADGSPGTEKDETTSNVLATTDTPEDGSTKKQTISSRSEQPFVQELDDGEDSKAARSSDNSRARSGSSRDYQKRRDGVEEEVMQGHSTRMGSVKRHFDEKEQGVHRRNRDGRQELERNRMAVKGREDTYSYREFDPNPVHLHMRADGYDRRKERDNSDMVWQQRDDDPYSRRIKTEETRKRERGDEMQPRHRSKIRESDRSDKDEPIHLRKQMDNGSHRVYYEKDVGPRHREREDSLKGRYEHIDDYHGKRKKDEEHLRRDHVDKEEILHGHRENMNRRKRERDEVLDPRKREGQQRHLDDHHSVRHKDEGWLQRERGERQREREDWQRLKQSHEEIIPKRERDEGRSVTRSGRVSEDKGWVGHPKLKDDSKGSDKDYQYKETLRHIEPAKRRDRIEDEGSHHGGNEDIYARGNQLSNGERRSRQERLSIRNDRSINVSEDVRVHDKKHRESARRNKEFEGGDNSTLVSSKRHQEEHGIQNNETGLKGSTEQGFGEHKNLVQHPLSRKQREGASDDEQHDSRRGRSKLERWTSHKERDFSIKSKSSTLKFKEMDKNNIRSLEGTKHSDEPFKPAETLDIQHPSAEEKDAADPEAKDGDTKPLDDRHLDTVEKLKKRSERFKLPMPSEKEAITIKKVESEVLPSVKSVTLEESEIKPERPARKRRWISS